MNYYNLYDTKEDVSYEHLKRSQVVEITGISKNKDLSNYIDVGDMIKSRYKIEFDYGLDDGVVHRGKRNNFDLDLLNRWDKVCEMFRRCAE